MATACAFIPSPCRSDSARRTRSSPSHILPGSSSGWSSGACGQSSARPSSPRSVARSAGSCRIRASHRLDPPGTCGSPRPERVRDPRPRPDPRIQVLRDLVAQPQDTPVAMVRDRLPRAIMLRSYRAMTSSWLAVGWGPQLSCPAPSESIMSPPRAASHLDRAHDTRAAFSYLLLCCSITEDCCLRSDGISRAKIGAVFHVGERRAGELADRHIVLARTAAVGMLRSMRDDRMTAL